MSQLTQRLSGKSTRAIVLQAGAQLKRAGNGGLEDDQLFEDAGAVYLTSKPLKDGTYDWRPWAHNGIDWVEGKIACRVYIDGVAPAKIDEVRMDVSPEGQIVLDWDLVTIDLEGRPEYVTKYHVYRYKLKSMFFVVRPFRYATVDQPPFEDGNADSVVTPLVFYKVTAEDEAGNETERRY